MQSINDTFLAIADPTRREILNMLSNDSMSINAIAQNFDMSRPAVSKHIKVLNTAGFITIEDVGRERYCILHKEGFDNLQEWLSYFDSFWDDKLHRLEQLLDAKKEKK